MQKQGRSVRTPTKEKHAETETVGEDTDQGERTPTKEKVNLLYGRCPH
jgi:hypothetical protein